MFIAKATFENQRGIFPGRFVIALGLDDVCGDVRSELLVDEGTIRFERPFHVHDRSERLKVQI